MARGVLAALWSFVWLPLAAPASAQSTVEVFGGLTVSLSPPSGTFETEYVPTLVFGTVTGGRAEHVLALDGNGRLGFDFGVTWLPTGRVGLQLLVGRAHHALDGANVDYELALDYLARPPPDYLERPFSVRQSIPWPDTAGDMTIWRVALNGVARASARHVDFTVSGGLLWSRVSGRFEQAGYYEYRLGGHSTLFYTDVLLDMAFDAAWQPGFDVGAEVGWRVSRNFGLTAGIRFSGPALEPGVIVGEVLNQPILEVPRADIDAALGGKTATFDPWGSPELRFGVRVGF